MVAGAEALDRADSGNNEAPSPRRKPRRGRNRTYPRRPARHRSRRFTDRSSRCTVSRAPPEDGREIAKVRRATGTPGPLLAIDAAERVVTWPIGGSSAAPYSEASRWSNLAQWLSGRRMRTVAGGQPTPASACEAPTAGGPAHLPERQTASDRAPRRSADSAIRPDRRLESR